jgi:trigger factor
LGESKTKALAFPKWFVLRELAGKKALLQLKVLDIMRPILLDLDDEFAKDLGDYASLEELRQKISQDLQKQFERKKSSHIKKEVVRRLTTESEMELPLAAITAEAERFSSTVAGLLLAYLRGLENNPIAKEIVGPPESYLDFSQEQLEELASTRLKTWLVLEAVAERENIQISAEDLKQEQYPNFLGELPLPIAVYNRQDWYPKLLQLHKAADLLVSHCKIQA